MRPFVVQNLGKYERQAWQVAEFGSLEQAAQLQQNYRNLILRLYHADPLSGYTWLHDVKNERMAHVGSVDAPVALGDIKALAVEFWKNEIQRAVQHWTQWVDYWAIDWGYSSDAFHNQWQSYRTRKDPTLQKIATHTYDEPGRYTIVIKVIDILGNDTTKSVQVEVS